MPSRPLKAPSVSPELTDAEAQGIARMFYERGRLKGKALRDAETARRKAGLPPPKIDEAIVDHFAKRGVRLSATVDIDEGDELANVEAAYGEPQKPRAPSSFVKDTSAQREAALREALALPIEDKLRAYGWLLGIPYDRLDEIPESLRSPEARPELPAWSLRAAYDALRDEYWCDLVLGLVDRTQLEAERQRRGLTAKRATHPDEAQLSKEQREHIRKLRVRRKTALGILARHESIGSRPEVIARSKSYVEAAERAIREARVSYGLPAEEVSEE